MNPKDTRNLEQIPLNNQKTCRIKIKRSNNKTTAFQFKTKCSKNNKSQTNFENTQRSFKNTFDYQHSEFTYI